MDLQSGVAIVTGSSSGVGAATARQLAELGCNVVVNYASNEQGARETVAACEAFGVETVVVRADVARDEDCRRLAAAAVDRWGRIDALVNNAGTTMFCAHDNLEGLSADDFQRIYAVNTVGAYQMVRAVAPAMRRGEGAHEPRRAGRFRDERETPVDVGEAVGIAVVVAGQRKERVTLLNGVRSGSGYAIPLALVGTDRSPTNGERAQFFFGDFVR